MPRKPKGSNVVPSTPKKASPGAVELQTSHVDHVASMLAKQGMSRDEVARVLYVMEAEKVRLQMITEVLPLTGALVKGLYEGNADTNAVTDALVTKLASIETDAKDDQTAAEIVAAYASLVTFVTPAERTAGTETDARRFGPADIVAMIAEHETGGGGGGVNASEFSLTQGTVVATGEYLGDNAPTIANPAAGEYTITVPAGTRLTWINVFGNNTTLNGSNEFLLRLDHSADSVDRKYTIQQFLASNGARQNVFSIGTNETQAITSNVTLITFPGMNAYGGGGFDLALS